VFCAYGLEVLRIDVPASIEKVTRIASFHFGTDCADVLVKVKVEALGPDIQVINITRAMKAKFHIYDADYVNLDQRGTLLEVTDELVLTPGAAYEFVREPQEALFV